MPKEETNPFANFNLLEGGLGNTGSDDNEDEKLDDDVITGDETVIEDEIPDLTTSIEADKLLEEIAKKQAKASKNKVEEELEETDEDESDDSEEVSAGFKPALTHLSDKGILEFNDSDIEDSEEGFEKAIEQTIKTKFEKLLQNKLGDEGLALLNFVENGGNPKDFISVYYNDSSWSDYDIENNEAAQKIVIRESLRLAGEEAEDIEDMITEFADNGTLEKRAKSAKTKLAKLEESQKVELLKSEELRNKQAKLEEKKYWDTFKANLLAKEDISGFKVTPKVKENLLNYMTVPDKTGKTEYQKAIEANEDSAYLFAYLSMNKFDISKLEKQVTSKAASKLNGLMKNYQSSTKEKISTGRVDINTEVTDPFAGFKKL